MHHCVNDVSMEIDKSKGMYNILNMMLKWIWIRFMQRVSIVDRMLKMDKLLDMDLVNKKKFNIGRVPHYGMIIFY